MLVRIMMADRQKRRKRKKKKTRRISMQSVPWRVYLTNGTKICVKKATRQGWNGIYNENARGESVSEGMVYQ